MAREVTEFDASGVSQTIFDAHTHNYRKIGELAVDKDHLYTDVQRYVVTDDAETVAIVGNNADLEAVGITVVTQATETPNA